MKICVTGGAGYIGSHTCKALAAAGHTVVVYDNLSTGHRHFVRWGDFVHGDIRDTVRFPASCLLPLGVFIPAIAVYGTDYPTPDGTCIRDYIHVDDLARAHILAMEHLLGGGDSMALNLGTEQGSSVREIINGVAEISGKAVPCQDRERRDGDPACLVADAGKARTVLGWRAEKP